MSAFSQPVKVENWRSLKIHPLCAAFPDLSAEEFNELRDSIFGMGLVQPIIIYKNMILDGRHRFKVCLQEDIEPDFEEFVGPGSAYDYVVNTNLLRRNLTPAQKIEVARKLIEDIGDLARERQRGGRGGKLLATLAKSNTEPVHVDKEVAKAAGISPRTAQDALTVREGDPELWQEVLAGEKSISAAAKEHRAKSETRIITLDDWKKLSAAERLEAMKPTKKSSLNEQKNEFIGWARHSWNPVTGCLHNCPYCYARDIAARFYPHGFVPALAPDRLTAPLHYKPRPSDDPAERNIFTCSMADLFGKWVPEEWIEAVMQTVREAPQWNFLMLTKFPLRMVDREVPENVWLGTTVDTQSRVKAAEDAFARVPASTRWLSLEPLLEPLKFTRPELFQWVVIGGASASSQTPAWRPPFEWVMDLYRQFTEAGARVYFKDNLLASDFPWSEPRPTKAPKEFKQRRRI